VDKQRWQYMSATCSDGTSSPPCPAGTAPIGPFSSDKVMYLRRGAMAIKVTGLTPGVPYVLQANAIGHGFKLDAKANNGTWGGIDNRVPIFGTLLGTTAVNSHMWAPTGNLVFTPIADVVETPNYNESEVWIFVADADGSNPNGEPVANDRPCARFAVNEVCIDDIGLFKASDLGL
jgi:hypothetical protein